MREVPDNQNQQREHGKNRPQQKIQACGAFRALKSFLNPFFMGKETFGWKTKPDFPEDIYNPDKDCALFSEDEYGTFTLGAGEFAIFYPTDAHAPKMKNAGNSTIEKIVVKVRVY